MLDERDLNILRAIVDIYVREGVAVSSSRVKDSTGMGASTATIRNCMVRLEGSGLLAKPHVSAGRVPTDEGYRVYVDHLETDTRFAKPFSDRLRDELRDRVVDISTIMQCASRTLSDLSRQFAVVYGAIVQESRVRRIRLIQLEGARLLVAVHLHPDHERTVVLRVGRDFSPDVVARVENQLRDAVTDRSVREAKEALDSAIRDNMTEEGIITCEVVAHRDEIFSQPPSVELYFEDRGYTTERTELSNPKLLQLLLGLLHNKRYLTELLSARLAERTQVTIGHEHDDVQLRPFSLVTAGYRMGAARGTLGIIGPTRMRYDLIQALVGSAARELQAIGEEFL